MMGGGKHGAKGPVASKPNILHTLRIQTSAFGQCIPILYGTQRREMRLLWAGDFVAIPHTSTQSTGGKGGGGGGQTTSTTTYTYQTALEAALCEGPVLAIRNMWDEKGSSFLARVVAGFTVPGGGGNFTAASGMVDDLGVTRSDSYSVIVNDFGSDGTATLSGTQKTPMVQVTSGPVAGQYSRAGNVYTFAAGDAGKVMTITYTVGNPNTSGIAQPLPVYNLTLLRGARPETAWSYLVSRHPSQALGYNGIAKVVSSAFDLGASNNMKNLNFEVASQLLFGAGIEDAEPSNIITDIVQNSFYGLNGVVALDSLANLRNWCVANGLFISPFMDTQVACADFIDDILKICNAEAVWSENKLKIIPYGDTSIVGNGATYIAANNPIYDLGLNDLLSEVKISRRDPQDPNETINKVSIEWLNRANDYNPEPAAAQDDAAVAQFGAIEGSPVTHHAITTAPVAKLAANWELRRQVDKPAAYDFDLGTQFGLLECMDLVTLPLGDLNLGTNKYPVRIKGIKEDENGKYSLTNEDFPWGSAGSTLYPHQAVSGFSPQDQADAGQVNTPVIFEPPFRLCKSPTGNEIWIGVASSNPAWGGANVWYSPDGTTYKRIGTITAPARMGVIDSGGLASALDPDLTNNCPVDLTSSLATMQSGQQGDADNYRTMCYIAGANPEFISYQTATLVTANKYNLSYLRRGLGGTNPAAHLLNDPFLRLDESVWVWPYDPAIIGKAAFFKFTSFNTLGNMEQSLASATAYAYTVKGTAKVSGSEAVEELVITGTSAGGGGNCHAYRRFSTQTYAMVSGDELHFDVFFDPSSPNSAMGIDFEYGAGHSVFRSASINDQNGSSPFSTALTLGQWYHRKFILTSLAGNTINTWAVALEGDPAGLYKVAFANVRIINAGVLKATIFGVGANAIISVPVWTEGAASPDVNYSGVRCYSVHNYPKGFDPSTDQLGSGGSVPPSFTGALGYASTTTSVTAYWDGSNSSQRIAIFRDDGTAVPIPDGNQPITGLSSGTNYYTYPYGAESDLSKISFANAKTTSTPVGSPTYCYTAKDRGAAQQQSLIGNVQLSNGAFAVATTSSGSGGGSGGGDGSCLRASMFVLSRSRGLIRIRDVEIGEWILSRNDTWTEVKHKAVLPHENFIRFATRTGKAIECAPNHPFTMIDGESDAEVDRRANRIALYDQFYIRSGIDRIVEAKATDHDGDEKVALSCAPEPTFFAGEEGADILTHNLPLFS